MNETTSTVKGQTVMSTDFLSINTLPSNELDGKRSLSLF